MKDPTLRLWARCKPAGEPWTPPQELPLGSGGSLGEFTVAVGTRGHLAVAWVTDRERRVQLVRSLGR